MATTPANKAQIIQEHQAHERDCGSTDVQVALLTARIRQLTEHLKGHAKDSNTRRGLLLLVGQRNRLLRYRQRLDPSRYEALIDRLDIRGVKSGG